MFSSEFSSLAPVSHLDILKVLKRVRHNKFVGLDDISGSVISCSDILVPAMKHDSNPRLSERFSYFMETNVPVFKTVLPLFVIADSYLLLITFPDYSNLLFMSMFHIT
jgi:hypothetical protein